MKDNGAQPAFPLSGIETDMEQDNGAGSITARFPRTYSYEKDAGLTKREYFAARAMQGLLADEASDGVKWAVIAKDALSAADALLAALQGNATGRET